MKKVFYLMINIILMKIALVDKDPGHINVKIK